MLKIAVASENKMVAEHFGHCESFMLFETKNNEISKIETIANPGHRPDFLPSFLANQKVNVIIAGGMGARAIELFNENNIEVIVGAEGCPTKVVNSYLAGELKSTGSVCHEHKHHGECGE